MLKKEMDLNMQLENAITMELLKVALLLEELLEELGIMKDK